MLQRYVRDFQYMLPDMCDRAPTFTDEQAKEMILASINRHKAPADSAMSRKPISVLSNRNKFPTELCKCIEYVIKLAAPDKHI